MKVLALNPFHGGSHAAFFDQLINRLSYPEIVPDFCLYDSLEQAAAMIADRACKPQAWQDREMLLKRNTLMRSKNCTRAIDRLLLNLLD